MDALVGVCDARDAAALAAAWTARWHPPPPRPAESSAAARRNTPPTAAAAAARGGGVLYDWWAGAWGRRRAPMPLPPRPPPPPPFRVAVVPCERGGALPFETLQAAATRLTRARRGAPGAAAVRPPPGASREGRRQLLEYRRLILDEGEERGQHGDDAGAPPLGEERRGGDSPSATGPAEEGLDGEEEEGGGDDKGGDDWAYEFVYFTEADHVTHCAPGLERLLGNLSLDPRVLVVPSRGEERLDGHDCARRECAPPPRARPPARDAAAAAAEAAAAAAAEAAEAQCVATCLNDRAGRRFLLRQTCLDMPRHVPAALRPDEVGALPTVIQQAIGSVPERHSPAVLAALAAANPTRPQPPNE